MDNNKTKDTHEEEKGSETQPLTDRNDETDSVETLSFRLEEVQRKCIQISETFSDFYGENDAKMWFEQVKSNFSRYLEDDRRIFKELAHLHSEKLALEQLIHMAKKREEYAELSLPELTDVVLHLERKLQQFEQQTRGGKKGFGCKYIISIGGREGTGKAMPYCFAIDLETHERQQLPDLPTARYHSAAFTINSQVYVVGGLTSSSVWTTAFENFDFISGNWTAYDGVPAVLKDIKGSVHGNNILVWGRTNEKLLLIFMFDTAKRSWEVIPSPPDEGSDLHVTYANNKILCQVIFEQPRNPGQANSPKVVCDMKLYVLELNNPSLSWTEADHKLSSLKALLFGSRQCNLTYSRSHEEMIYLDCISIATDRPEQPFTIRTPTGYDETFYKANMNDGGTTFFSYCMRTNTYCRHGMFGQCVTFKNSQAWLGKLLACHSDMVICQHNGGIRLFVPSNEAVMNICFRDPPHCVNDGSVAIVYPLETHPIAIDNAPC